MQCLPISIAVGHPVFAGHFPGRPIVPGVMLLDTALLLLEEATGLTLGSLASAKFVSPATPGEALSLDYLADESAVRFDIRCGLRKVATGRFLIDHGSPA